MSEPNQKPTLEEVFPILRFLELVKIEDCKSAYDRLDTTSPGYQVNIMHGYAAKYRSTRKIIEELWPNMTPEKYSREKFEDLALAIEYAVRTAAD